MSIRPFGLLLVLLAAPLVASAQTSATPLPRPGPSVVFAPHVDGPLDIAWSSVSPDTVRTGIRPSYWKEGAIVGGIAGALGGGLMATAVCGLSEERGKDCTGSMLLGGLVGAGLGGMPGALIGGLFPKEPRKTTQHAGTSPP